jgi:hypothetical protein
MQLAQLLVGGLLATGLATGLVAAGDEHLAFMKMLHGGCHGAPEAALVACPDMAAVGLMHEALGRIGLAAERGEQLHEQMAAHATVLHESLAQLVSARDAQLRAVLAVPADPAALQDASRQLASAEQAVAGASSEMHAAIRARLSDAERQAFDAARDALLVEAADQHAELRQQVQSGAFGPRSAHGH